MAHISLYKPGSRDAEIADGLALASAAAAATGAVTWILGENGQEESAVVPVHVARAWLEDQLGFAEARAIVDRIEAMIRAVRGEPAKGDGS